MRLVHLADLHLGFRQYQRLTPAGLNQREADVAHAFRRAVDQTVALRPDLVLIAGDVFHSVRPMNPAIIHAFVQFTRLRQALPEAVIVMIAGNHDRPRSTETGCILRLFAPLGIEVVDSEPRQLSFPDKDLSVLAVPDMTGPPPALVPDSAARYNVLLLHGQVEGVLPAYVSRADRAPLEITHIELAAPRWSYVALGHYHVHREIAPNAYYAGSLDYTSSNPWGELIEERRARLPGKGFIEYDLASRELRFHTVAPGRPLVDLPAIAGRALSAADLDARIRSCVENCEGGIDDRVVRLVARDVPRHIARDLDHKAIREYKRRALHFNLDLRRPDVVRSVIGGGEGWPSRRPTLRDTLESYLGRRPLESDVDRQALVRLGLRYLEEAQAANTIAPAANG